MAKSDGYNQQVGGTSTDAYSLTHTGQRDGDSAGSTWAFRGAESASRFLRRKRLWKIIEEERSVPVWQHFVLSDTRYLLPCSPSL